MKTVSQSEFFCALQSASRAHHFPLKVMTELTYRCNFHCAHCYVSPALRAAYAGREMPLASVFSLLDGLRGAGCLYLGFTGGEPLLHKDIFAILSAAVKKGFRVTLNTNGFLLNSAAIKELARLTNIKVDITLHSTDERIFDRVCGVSGAGKKVLGAVDGLLRAGVPLGLKMCLLDENRQCEKDVRAFAKKRGLFLRVSNELFPALTPLAVRAVSLKSVKRAPEKYWSCGAGLSQCAVTPAGEIKFCQMIQYPLYPAVADFGSAWNKTVNAAASAAASAQCPSCKKQNTCGLCPAYGWLNGSGGGCGVKA